MLSANASPPMRTWTRPGEGSVVIVWPLVIPGVSHAPPVRYARGPGTRGSGGRRQRRLEGDGARRGGVPGRGRRAGRRARPRRRCARRHRDGTAGARQPGRRPARRPISRSVSEVEAAFDELRGRWGEVNALVNAAGPGRGRHQVLRRARRRRVGRDVRHRDARARCAACGVRCRCCGPRTWAGSSTSRPTRPAGSRPSLVAYTASKAAMTSVGKNLAQSLAPDGILVNTVSPGSFLSEGMRSYLGRCRVERGIDPDSLTGRDAGDRRGLRPSRPSCRVPATRPRSAR